MTDAELIAAVRAASAREAAAKKARDDAQTVYDSARAALNNAGAAYLEAREESVRAFNALGCALTHGDAA